MTTTSAGPTTGTTIIDLVSERAEKHSDHLALVVDGGPGITVGDWVSRSESVARALVDRGVRPGDRVAVVSGPGGWIDYGVADLAVYLAGGTAVALADLLGSDVLRRRAERCDVVAVVVTEDAILIKGVNVAGSSVPCWTVAELQTSGASAALPDGLGPDAIAEIVYTSGTTGPAKRVAVSHANLTFGRDSRGELFGGIESILCAVPAGTNAGHSALMVGLTTGSRAHVLGSVEPLSIARAVYRERIQHAILPPAAAAALVRSGLHRQFDLSSLKALMFGSSAVPDAVVCELSQALPDAQIMIGYGSTESAPAFTRRSLPAWNEHGDPGLYRAGGLESLGRPGGGTELAIVDENGTPVPDGTVGQICLRGEAPARGYLDPDERGVFAADGWVRMGDYGLLDSEGELRFVDRMADGIVRDGHRVSSASVENALMWHPAVRAAAVFATPAREPAVIAAVEIDGDTTTEQLHDFLSGRLDPPDVPTRVVIVKSLPRGPIGKVQKHKLRAAYSS